MEIDEIDEIELSCQLWLWKESLYSSSSFEDIENINVILNVIYNININNEQINIILSTKSSSSCGRAVKASD